MPIPSSRRAFARLLAASSAALAVTGLALVPAAMSADAALPSPPEVLTARPSQALSLAPIGTYQTGVFDSGASEIVGYDARTQSAFVINAQDGTVDVLDISRPRFPSLSATLDTPGANSVAVHGSLVAVAQQAENKTAPGSVSFFRTDTLAKLGEVPAGSLPDMVTFSPNGNWAIVANEGEPEGYCDGQVDPEGSISVIDLRHGIARASVRSAGFAVYNGHEDQLRAQGIRIFGPNASAAQDIEPEYVAVSPNSLRAWVTLQENNAIALVDIRSATVTDIVPLGTKDHSGPGQGLDPSDRDGGATIGNWPVQGLYMPDGINTFRANGRPFLVTANEGDARDWDCFAEEARVKDLTLDPAAFPEAEALQADEALGRLTVTSTLGEGPDGYTALYALGGRSISILNGSGQQVWDTGDALEQLTAEVVPDLFNSDHAENDSVDTRSDNKGPEPEGVVTGKVRGHMYAFVGLERESGLVVYDVTNPHAPELVTYADNRDPLGDAEAGTAGDLGPEGVLFVPAGDSPIHKPLLLVGNEVSGTTTVWTITGS